MQFPKAKTTNQALLYGRIKTAITLLGSAFEQHNGGTALAARLKLDARAQLEAAVSQLNPDTQEGV